MVQCPMLRGSVFVATRDIKMGDLIVEDRAAVSVSKEEHKLLTSDSSKTEVNMGPLGAFILEQVNSLPEHEREEFYSLSRHRKMMLPSTYSYPPGKEAKETLIAAAIFMNNVIAGHLYLTISLVNHSCAPNSCCTIM